MKSSIVLALLVGIVGAFVSTEAWLMCTVGQLLMVYISLQIK